MGKGDTGDTGERSQEIPAAAAWLLRGGTVLAWCLSLAGFLGAMAIAESATRNWFLPEVGLALCTVVTCWFLAVLIHESGHALAAHLKGMRVMRMQAGILDVIFLRRGFRWRIARPPGGLHGYVQAYPDPAEAIRPAMLCMIVGGPLANLAAAILAVLLTRCVEVEREGLVHAFALINGVVGITNLMPMARGWASDGLLLYLWGRRSPDEQSSLLAHLRLMSLSVFGTTSDRLPEQLVDDLDAQGSTASLIALWIRMKASQNLGNWKAVEALDDQLEQILSGMPGKEQRENKPLLVLLRLELAFSRAMHEQRAAPLGNLVFGKGVDWLVPHLRHRHAALASMLAGEWSAAEAALLRVRRHAEASQDRALAESENRISRHIRALGPTFPSG